MPVYKAPLDDIRFLLNDVHDVAQLSALPGYEEATPDIERNGARDVPTEEGGRGSGLERVPRP